jgi:outer membrane protein assembly factor BamB
MAGDLPSMTTGPHVVLTDATGDQAVWSQAMADSRHSGSSNQVGPKTSNTVWTRNLGAPVMAGAVVASNGTIYDSADNGILHALNPATGADEWTYDAHGSTDNHEDLSTSPAVLPNGTILWPGPRSTLYAISRSGKLLWSRKLAGTVLSPTVTSGGIVIVADSDGDVLGLQPKADGSTQLWRVNIGSGSFSFGTPAIGSNGTIYVTSGRELVALEVGENDVKVRWRFTVGAAIEVSASVSPDGTVVVGTNSHDEYGVAPSGKIAWKYRLNSYSFSTPAVTRRGVAYFGDNNGYVDVADASNGHPVQRDDAATTALSPMGVGVWTAPVVDADQDVYAGTASGHIVGFNSSGMKLFDIATGAIVASYPALTANGTLLIGSDNGTLYAVHG